MTDNTSYDACARLLGHPITGFFRDVLETIAAHEQDPVLAVTKYWQWHEDWLDRAARQPAYRPPRGRTHRSR